MSATISLIKGDGIGVDVSDAAMTLVNQAIANAAFAHWSSKRSTPAPPILPKLEWI